MSVKERSCLLIALCLASSAIANDVPDFGSQIQPILRKHCFECHGPETQESNFRLDLREHALRGGDLGPAIVPEKSKESPLVRYVSRQNADMVMPPDGEGTPLTNDQISLIRHWIDGGAPWPDEFAGNADAKRTTDHWSFQPVRDLDPPSTDEPWVRNAIDRFILAKLREKSLSPSAPADRITLIRRIYLDVHGLPPTPNQVAAFKADKSGQAYETLIERVLESPHYGERWARHWLDVARFGESTGFEVNRDRETAYHYRDYVIDSLNEDKPFRDFIIEQLAGDVVGKDVGTGFLVGGPYDMVKSPDVNLTLMQRQDELADFVNTTATAFLGLTVGCARCHNHKFDPILQTDYYAMQAVFAGVQHGEREIGGKSAEKSRAAIANLKKERVGLESNLDQLRLQAPPATQKKNTVSSRQNVVRFDSVDAKFLRFTILQSTGGEPCIDELEIYTPQDRNVALTTNGAKAAASGTLPGYEIHKLAHINDGRYGNERSWISSSAGSGWVQIEFPHVKTINRLQWGRDRTGRFRDRLATSFKIEVATELGKWQLAHESRNLTPEGSHEDDTSFVSRLPKEQRDHAEALIARRKSIDEEIARQRVNIPKAYIGTFRKPETIRRLYRGDPLSPKEVVLPDAISIISSLELNNETPERERRLALANWIADDKNPLTARVIVNRVWHYHFGTGLVSTPSDLGKNGTKPSHPQLLDWLAWNFMQNGWSLKWLHREILMSATYRQSSQPRADGLTIDADSRLLWRFPPRRLEAEAIRDCVLHVAGSLEHRGGGPGFLLLDIEHENVHHYFPKRELGPPEFRRMIYMTKIRQEQDGVFGVFDCPDGGQVIPNRSRSTTPLQALNLLNSEFMIDQANTLAKRVKENAEASGYSTIDGLFNLAFSRKPTVLEKQLARKLAERHGMEAVCRAILNSNEFLFLQ